jgi:hypothetical protein
LAAGIEDTLTNSSVAMEMLPTNCVVEVRCVVTILLVRCWVNASVLSSEQCCFQYPSLQAFRQHVTICSVLFNIAMRCHASVCVRCFGVTNVLPSSSRLMTKPSRYERERDTHTHTLMAILNSMEHMYGSWDSVVHMTTATGWTTEGSGHVGLLLSCCIRSSNW